MSGGKYIDGYSGQFEGETNHGRCACEHGYFVSDQYSYEDAVGVLHGKKHCGLEVRSKVCPTCTGKGLVPA